ncbi:MAG: hypothetical protein CMM56_02235 [Rhodospirillaceae bacterium]|nr:hypothetical protein [Rhodospirillaceae bacterium]|tara:strand:- start:26924 stop:27937 length:1014 start_codon:yes stop_codon:yes gene_type:complete
MSNEPVRVAALGMGWWSDVLADAIGHTSTLEIAACYSRSLDKREAFASKYNCVAATSYDEILNDDSIQGIINTTPNGVHLETVDQAAQAGKHTFLDKPIANTVTEGKEITRVCAEANVILSVGYQRRRENQFRWIKEKLDAGCFGKLIQADANISRDRLGKVDLGSWRYQASGMPGGVILQIGVHYTDVLGMLMGPIKRVSAISAQLVLPGDNPDIANLIMEHENGSISNLTASYASASEYYLVNIYGKEATAYYDFFGGLRYLTRGDKEPINIKYKKNDPLVDELDEFAACIKGEANPEVGGQMATESLAVIRAGIKSIEEGRTVDVAEIMNSSDE